MNLELVEEQEKVRRISQSEADKAFKKLKQEIDGLHRKLEDLGKEVEALRELIAEFLREN